MAQLNAECALALTGTPRRASRWWLAGLLVTCLLPASLAQAGSLAQAERLVQACILAPALLRATRKASARRRAQRGWPRSSDRPATSRRPARRFLSCWPPAVAAHDVLTRRGPPFKP